MSEAGAAVAPEAGYVPVLQKKYKEVIRAELLQEQELKNVHLVPKLDKIVINVGFGRHAGDKKKIERVVEELTLISGQKPVITKARKSIAAFKLREGQNIGCKVTLRRARMYEFLDRLVNIALPRVKDFRGFPLTSFDKFGNYAIGLKDHTVFQEIAYDKIEFVWGMDIVFVSQTPRAELCRALLEKFNFPFRKKQ